MLSRNKIIFFTFALYAVLVPLPSSGASIFNVRDQMSSQKIGEPSNHTVTFRSFSGVAGGAITLDFHNVASSMGSVDHTDIDLSYGRETGAEASALLGVAQGSEGMWGVTVDRNNKTISLLFPASGGIPIRVSDRVIIKIGTNATSQTTGDARIINALAPINNAVIDITAGADIGQTAVVILSRTSIGVNATQPTPIAQESRQPSIVLSTSPVRSTPAPQQIIPQKNPPTEELKKEQKADVVIPRPLIGRSENEKELTKPPLEKKPVLPVPVTNVPAEQKTPPVLFVEKPRVQEQLKQPAVQIPPEIPLPVPAKQTQAPAKSQPPAIILAEPVTTVIAPQQQETVLMAQNSDGSGVTITVPESIAVPAPVVFSIQAISQPQAQTFVPDIELSNDTVEIVGGLLYRIDARYAASGENTRVGKYITIAFHYTDAQADGLVEETMKAFYWDEKIAQWNEAENNTVDTAANIVTVRVSHFSVYSLRANVATDAKERKKRAVVRTAVQARQNAEIKPQSSNTAVSEVRPTQTFFAAVFLFIEKIWNAFIAVLYSLFSFFSR
ncbi:hypothetical protein HY732_04645 [Candidatus Uhrbacteria bacterium]|nr:hypothetical protein [Candidatus Uhrbacteria bacterium]